MRDTQNISTTKHLLMKNSHKISGSILFGAAAMVF